MTDLDILKPTLEPLATEHIPEMILAIQELERRNLAYAVDGDVYYSVADFPEYGKLSGRDKDQLLAGARIEVDERKRDPLDFALWKRSQPDEPSWESPWGLGRPGWHIECTCMSQKYLSETFDIHGGGLDLVFPHHENEIAQSEGLTGKPFANFWIHNGPLTREGTKMSKSLGNILSIQDALQQYHPEELRLFMLMGHYRKPLDFSTSGMADAQAALDRLYSTLLRVQEIVGDASPAGSTPALDAFEGPGRGVSERVGAFRHQFQETMDDDFNSAQALALIFDLNRALNQWMDHASFAPNDLNMALLGEALGCYDLCAETLGLLTRKPRDFFGEKEDRTLSALGLSRQEADTLIAERTEARRRKDWKEADRIRDELHEMGIQVLDSAEGTTWKVRPGAIRSEME
jgi:cysteinyl-tRNA synthetase